MEPVKRVFIGVFLVSMASIALEISLSRIFAISQWFHFAFMVISIAFFGFAASGTLFAVFPTLLKRDLDELMLVFCLLFAVSTVASFLLTNPVPFDPYQLMWDSSQLLRLVYYYVLWSLPFLFAGGAVALAMTKLSKEVNLVYFSNLVGSALGSALTIALLPLLPESGALMFAAVLGAFSAMLFAPDIRYRISTGAFIVLLVVLMLAPPALNISPYKGLNQALNFQGARIVETHWDAQSRVDVVDSGGIRVAPGLSFKYKGDIPKQIGITVDGDSLSAVPVECGDYFNFTPLALPYQLASGRSLVVNPMGSLEISAAVRSGGEVDVTETNPLVAGMVKKHTPLFGEVDFLVGGVRDLPDKKYDVITLPTSGDAASASLGIYGMSEDYMFTVEGFEEYIGHLEPGGYLAVTRWLQNPPKELPRIVAIAARAVEDPERQIAVIRTYVTSTVLVKNGEINEGDILRIRSFVDDLGYDLVYYPGISESEVNLRSKFPEPFYYEAVKSVLAGDYDYVFDITPPTDDKPYFSNFFRFDKAGELYDTMGQKWEPFFEGGFVIFFVLIQAVILSLVFIFLPVVSFRKIKKRVKGKWPVLAYFFCIGMGFMMFEIACIQKLTLWVGQNVYSFSLVLTSMLLFTGVGSFMSRKMKEDKLRLVMGALVLALPIYALLFSLNPGGGIYVRAAIAFLLLAPAAFLMGMPFPAGIKIADKMHNNLIPWSWATNGCASVLGSIIGALVAISMGLSVVFLLASLFYLFALISVRVLKR